MDLIRFESRTEIARFRSPLHGMELRDHPVEIRRDPLTGRTAVASRELATKAEMFFGVTDWELVEERARRTRDSCFFCPEKVLEATPRYPEDLLPGGVLRRGEAILFPNLFPLAAIHSVVCWPDHHFLRPGQFALELLEDALGCAVEFARLLEGRDEKPCHLSICCNHMAPAGASLVHPHLQVYGGETPPATLCGYWHSTASFRREAGVGYWSTLVEEERRRGERYIGGGDGCHWLAPFAPEGGREILAVVPERSRCADLGRAEIHALARGLSHALAWYEEEGLSAFNFTLYSGPSDPRDGELPVLLRLIARSAFQREYRCDDYFLQRQLGSELVVDAPERIARTLGERWGT